MKFLVFFDLIQGAFRQLLSNERKYLHKISKRLFQSNILSMFKDLFFENKCGPRTWFNSTLVFGCIFRTFYHLNFPKEVENYLVMLLISYERQNTIHEFLGFSASFFILLYIMFYYAL